MISLCDDNFFKLAIIDEIYHNLGGHILRVDVAYKWKFHIQIILFDKKILYKYY